MYSPRLALAVGGVNPTPRFRVKQFTSFLPWASPPPFSPLPTLPFLILLRFPLSHYHLNPNPRPRRRLSSSIASSLMLNLTRLVPFLSSLSFSSTLPFVKLTLSFFFLSPFAFLTSFFLFFFFSFIIFTTFNFN